MSTTICLRFLALLMVAGIAESICCEAIKSEVEEKDRAYKTLCHKGNNLPAHCCRDIALEVEKHRSAYKALCSSNQTSTCIKAPKALGMESGKIPNAAITASSSYSSSYLPAYGRLRKVTTACSWTPSVRSGSWLQVDLGQRTVVTGVASQGSCYGGERTLSYTVSYSNDGTKWTQYLESGSGKVFTGNTDQTTVVSHSFNPPITARYVRFLPKTWIGYPTTRIEYYGCPLETVSS